MGAQAHASALVTLASFDNSNGAYPEDGLTADAAGNLYGTTKGDGTTTFGTVFEIVKTGTTYGSPVTIATFNGTNGASPIGGLVADAAGNLFGTTSAGGTSGKGTVFEIVKTGSTYASSPTTIVTFTGSANGSTPDAGLILDAAGNLYGTTHSGGTSGNGTVFEVTKTGSTYSPTVTTLANGGTQYGGLVADATGNLFGMTYSAGAHSDGSVFEIAKSGSTYSSLTTLLSFSGGTGQQDPKDTLLIDAAGNLFGTTYYGGASGYGTVFELANGSGGYASLATTLASFTDNKGAYPYGGLVADINGNLYGTTSNVGTGSNVGTVYEIAKTSSGYGSLSTLVNFNGANGANPYGGVIVDTAGNLFGTTMNGGAYGYGTVFEYAVPEPATLTLFGTALLGAITRRSRRATAWTARLVRGLA